MPGDPFYHKPEWRSLRKQALIRDRYRCVVCGRDVSGKGESRVDHKLSRKTHPHLALSLANLRTLCADHDNQGHREKATGATQRDERFVIRGADAQGWPLDPTRR